MKKIPKGAEASNILVGEVDFLDKSLSAFVRYRRPFFAKIEFNLDIYEHQNEVLCSLIVKTKKIPKILGNILN